MKKTHFIIIYLFCGVGFLLAQSQDIQKKQIHTFEERVISTDDAIEYALSFSPEENEVYFARSQGKWGQGDFLSSIYFSEKKNGKWSKPVIAPFSGIYDDSDPHVSKDGNTIYFISKRPSENDNISADIWTVSKDSGGQWGQPVRLDNTINSNKREYSPRTTNNGDLYFASDRLGGYGQGDLYVAKKREKGFLAAVNLGNTINSSTGEWNLEINDTGNLIIFEASQRKENVSSFGDLYISFKISGEWTLPQNLNELNTTGSDLYPELINNNQTLYYTSSDSLKGQATQIYYTDFNLLYNKYKKQAVPPKKYLLVVNRSGHSVAVFDIDTKKVIKTIPTGIGPHEISLSKNNKYAFVANYGSYPEPHSNPITSSQLQWVDKPQNTITKIDLLDFTTTTFTIPKTVSHHGIVCNFDGSKLWVTAENEGMVIELDGNTGAIVDEYPTMKGSHIIKSSHDFSKLYVSNIESNTISIIHLLTKEVTHIKVPNGPEGIEISPDGRRLWVLCNSANKAVIIKTDNVEVEKVVDVKGKFPIKITFINNEAWISNVFSKNISIFDIESLEYKNTIALETTPLSILSDSGQVFVSLPRKNLIRVFNPKTRKVMYEFTSGIEPDGMAILNNGNSHTSK